MNLETDIPQVATANEWGGTLSREFDEVNAEIQQWVEQGKAKEYGFGSSYWVTIEGKVYSLRYVDDAWQVSPKVRQTKPKGLISPPAEVLPVKLCYNCGYNDATANGLCVSCID